MTTTDVSPTSPRPRFPWVPLLAGLTLAAGLLVSTLLITDDPADDQPVPVGHIHGLAVQDDGDLIVGAHFGVFEIHDDGGVDPLGDRRSDTMALTDAGDDRLIASGHPDLSDLDAPINAGLLESTDGALTWSVVSLAGEADFHALDHIDGRTWGIDSVSGELLTSPDSISWTSVEAPPMIDLAAAPTGEPRVVAVTGDGRFVRVGLDGRTTQLPAPPGVLLVDWPAADVLVGVEGGGTVHVSSDEGATWARVGRVDGEPTALASTGRQHYVATTSGVQRLSNGGGPAETLVTAEH